LKVIPRQFDYNPVMKFRLLAASFIFILLPACTGLEKHKEARDMSQPARTIVSTKHFSIHQKLSLINSGEDRPEKQNLWVALIQDFPPYQNVSSRKISPNQYTLLIDEYGNQYAEFDLSDHEPGRTISIDIYYEVSVNEITYDLSHCEGEFPDEFTQPELHIESANPQIVSLAEDLSKRKGTTCEQVRAFYEYAGDSLVYTYNRNAWGAQATFGLMGADCTEFASLVIALSRAEGIPARYFEGLLYLENIDADNGEKIAQTEHAWLDVYLPGIGWTAMDPTLGRWLNNRDTYFAHFTPNHIIVTMGRNPSVLRGASYWSHLYWPGNGTNISVSEASWNIQPLE